MPRVPPKAKHSSLDRLHNDREVNRIIMFTEVTDVLCLPFLGGRQDYDVTADDAQQMSHTFYGETV